MPCLTVSYNPSIGPILQLAIARPLSLLSSESEKQQRQAIGVTALIDTGASITCISQVVAERAGLQVYGKIPMQSASHTVSANAYIVDLLIPFGADPRNVLLYTVTDHTVMEFQTDNSQFQALLGRDILSRGMLQLTGYNNTFTFCL